MANRKNGSITSIMSNVAVEFPTLPLSKKKSGTPMRTAGVKHISCLLVRLNITLLLTFVKSFDKNTDPALPDELDLVGGAEVDGLFDDAEVQEHVVEIAVLIFPAFEIPWTITA